MTKLGKFGIFGLLCVSSSQCPINVDKATMEKILKKKILVDDVSKIL